MNEMGEKFIMIQQQLLLLLLEQGKEWLIGETAFNSAKITRSVVGNLPTDDFFLSTLVPREIIIDVCFSI